MRGSKRRKGDGWELRAGSVSRMYHGNERGADRALRKLVDDVESGKARPTSHTVADLMKRWLDFKKPRVAVLTWEGYEIKVRCQVLPYIGKVKLSQLDEDRLDGLYVDLIAKGLSARTVNHVHRIISQALGQAVRWKWVSENIASRVTPPPATKREIVIPDGEKLQAMCDEIVKKNVPLAVFIFIASTTGVRRGELCALRWSRVDFAGATISIQKSIAITATQGVIEKETKRPRSRAKISIDAASVAALALLNQHMAERAALAGEELLLDGYVFTDTFDGSQPWDPAYVTRAWRYHKKRYGLEKARLHDVRHYLASVLLNAGIPIEAVSQRLGHNRISTTQDIYSHLLEATDQAAAAVIGGLVKPLGGTVPAIEKSPTH